MADKQNGWHGQNYSADGDAPAFSSSATKRERIAAATQHLRMASINLMLAREIRLAEDLDEFIDAIESLAVRHDC